MFEWYHAARKYRQNAPGRASFSVVAGGALEARRRRLAPRHVGDDRRRVRRRELAAYRRRQFVTYMCQDGGATSATGQPSAVERYASVNSVALYAPWMSDGTTMLSVAS